MKQIATANGDFNLAAEIQVFSFALPAGPDSYHLRGEVRLGDGVKNIAGNGTYRLRATLDGVEVFCSDTVVAAGVTRRIVDFECWGRLGETFALLVTGLAGDVDVDVTTYLYTGVNVVEISEDAAAADALETVLDGTGGTVLKAAQLKLSCNVTNEGALDCANAHASGYGIRGSGGYAGQLNSGTAGPGQYNTGGTQGQYNYGGNTGQRNEGDNQVDSRTSPRWPSASLTRATPRALRFRALRTESTTSLPTRPTCSRGSARLKPSSRASPPLPPGSAACFASRRWT